MMANCCSTLVVNNRRLATRIKRVHGVFQGSILSPFLFNIFIDPLAVLLNSEVTLTPEALFYADDIVLKAKSNDRMRTLVWLCEIWAMENGMRWGIKKCGAVGSKGVFQLNGELIPSVSRYKYLGAPPRKARNLMGRIFKTKRG